MLPGIVVRIVDGPKFWHHNFEFGKIIGLPKTSNLPEADGRTDATKNRSSGSHVVVQS